MSGHRRSCGGCGSGEPEVERPGCGLLLAERLHWYLRARTPREGRPRLATTLAAAPGDGVDRGTAW
ncbi:hypothetical protein [Pseudonocardia nigra]|uniref:hypothetical protein n=1 Tax=Pseudonocardia nigra TaxID=1921578 RepID=UPI001C5F85E2|nr:hypothetical protein [Pseudonocardia nigra]